MSRAVSPILEALLATFLWSTTAEANRQHIVPLHRERVPVRNDDNVVSFKNLYYGNMLLGTQDFTMLFDTGSGHVIVPSVACRTEGCRPHNRYNQQLSQTGFAINSDGTPVKPGTRRDEMTVAFGTGEVTGQFVSDRLCLGKISKPNQSQDTSEESNCVDMRVVAATDMSDEPFASFPFDGIFGLGPDALALSSEFSFFNMLAAKGDLAHSSFGIFLAENDDDLSEISFGGHNPKRVSSEIAWAPLDMPEHGHWLVQIDAVRIGGKTLDFCADGQCRAVVDSGTSSIAVPSSFSESFLGELVDSMRDPPRSESSVTDCKQAFGHLLEFDIADTVISLSPGDYARPAVKLSEEDGAEEEAVAQDLLKGLGAKSAKQNQQVRCHPTFMPFDLPEPLGPKLFILGEPVLRKYYTVYDWQQKRIGFGEARHFVV